MFFGILNVQPKEYIKCKQSIWQKKKKKKAYTLRPGR